jgi:hypothetical protein
MWLNTVVNLKEGLMLNRSEKSVSVSSVSRPICCLELVVPREDAADA